MPAAATSSSRMDAKLVGKAVEALLKHHEENADSKNALLGNETKFEIQFGLSKVPEQASPKPRRVTIPHALWKLSDDDDDGEEPTVCLIVKEDSKEWVQELIDEFPKEMGLVKKVLGLESLRKKHSKFEQQRALLARFDVFMADDRILPMVAKALGKHFFQAKKQPIPVRLSRKTSLPSMILQSLQSTFWYLSEGTCLTVKAGHSGMSSAKLRENVLAICNHVPTKIPRQWANIKSIAVKTTHSVSLPVYNKTPQELKQIAKLAGLEEEATVEKNDDKKEEDDKKEMDRKKRKAKSPLIKALKKQQESEDGSPSKKKKRQGSIDKDEEDASPPKKQKKLATPKNSAKKDATPKISAKKSEAAPSAKRTKSDENKVESSKKKAKKEKPETPKSSKKEKPETPKSSKKEKSKEATTPKESEDFIAARKFKGSKKGFVFKKDKKGLGYYVDTPPEVDEMMMDALRRSAQNRGGGRGSSTKKKGRRGRR